MRAHAEVVRAAGSPAAAPRADVVPDRFTPDTRAQLEMLRTWRGFARGGQGITGAPSSGTLAAARLMTQPDGVAALEWLVVNGSAAGRLYGYWGLLELDPIVARSYAWMMASDGAGVLTSTGCLMSHRMVADIAAELVEPGPQLRTQRSRLPAPYR